VNPRPARTGRRLPILAATAGAALAAGIVLAVSLTLLGPPGQDPNAAPAVPDATAPYTTPPPAEVQQIHDTLADIAARCTPNPDADAQRELDRDVDVILAFARRNPHAEFPVDDETGHTLSLLLATRDDLSHCVPAAAARINPALPAQLRRPPSPTD
jgi:hypothetical protein